MLVWLGLCAVLSFGAAVAAALLAVSPAPTFGFAESRDTAYALAISPAAAFHLAFAAGAMPLVCGAIIHFVPVLTRSGMPAPAIRFLPVVVQLAGVITPLGLGGILPPWSLHAAASLASAAALLLLVWIGRRLRMTLGTPHPGARWYGAALLCLFLAFRSLESRRWR
jgi:hypothetical protein